MTVAGQSLLDEELTAPVLRDGFFAGDPWPHLARLRRAAPVAWNAETGVWVVSAYAEVAAVSADPATFCSGKGVLLFEIGVDYPSPPTMMHTDPPAHTRYRGLVQPSFRPRLIGAWEDAVRRRTRALLDAIPPGEVVDVVDALSVPLPLQVICDVLGIPSEDWPRFYLWSEAAIPGSREWADGERERLMMECSAYLLAAAQERRTSPRDDLVSLVAAAEIDGDRLSDAEIVMFLVQLLVAGNETTRTMFSAGLAALAEAPDQWERLRQDRSLVPGAVEEMLRWSSPVLAFMRTATKDVDLRDRTIGAGDPVWLVYASANRDEEKFGPTADVFDVARDPNPHLSFGYGAHFCLGAPLTRLEGRVVLEEMLDRYATIEAAGPVGRINSNVIAGITTAPLVFR
ncbi:MAG: cytochrome P450 [Actinomycetes bacterium]